MSDIAVYLGCSLLLIGSLSTLLAALGVLRLPDLLTRMHAASKAGVVGGGMVLLAVGILSFDAAVTLRAVIGIVFLLLTTPLSAHLLAKAAHQYRGSGTVLRVDELTLDKSAQDEGPAPH